ncbi:MAG: glycoside hydrolase domain-containing protein, partial [Acidobacteriaceae bacterium]
VRAAGFGFLVLFNGRLDAQLKGQDAAGLGRTDATAAVAAAKQEGFPAGAVIFLDEEEGGSLLAEQADYIGAWIAVVGHSGYKVGVYCSVIAVPSGAKMMSTAQDIEGRFPEAKLWVWDDRCPPAPGCAVPKRLDLAKSGLGNALVWQYAQSPQRREDTAACQQTYAADGRCYAPDLARSGHTYIDMNVSRSPDPSHGR